MLCRILPCLVLSGWMLVLHKSSESEGKPCPWMKGISSVTVFVRWGDTNPWSTLASWRRQAVRQTEYTSSQGRFIKGRVIQGHVILRTRDNLHWATSSGVKDQLGKKKTIIHLSIQCYFGHEKKWLSSNIGFSPLELCQILSTCKKLHKMVEVCVGLMLWYGLTF